MAWYLAACIVAQLLESAPALLRWNPYWLLAIKTGAEPLKDFTNICHLAEAAALCLLGPICIFGLYRRRDWARKGCIIIFALSVVAWLSYIDCIWHHRPWNLESAEVVRRLLLGLASCATEGLPAMLTTLFLLTGLRGRSLCRKGEQLPPVLSTRRFHPRCDWLLLVCFVLIGLGIGWTTENWAGIQVMKQAARATGVIGSLPQPFDLLRSIAILRIAIGLLTLIAAALIWFRASVVRLLTAALLASAVGVEMLESVMHYTMQGTPDPLLVAHSIMNKATTILPYLALASFAFLAVGKEDIQRLEAPG